MIYRDEIEILEVIPDKRVIRNEIMGDHVVSIKFELSEYFQLKKGDYIIENEAFYLREDYTPTINKSTNGYKYDLEFFDKKERFKDFKVKFNGELEFDITSSGDRHLDVIVSSLVHLGDYTIGEYPDEIREVHYENIDIFSALNLIAETYELEWWINGYEINIGRYEHGEPILLEYDYELDDISVGKSNQKSITRLYAFGSDKNTGQRLTIPPIDISESESEVIEGVVYFDDVYPRQKQTITSVSERIIAPTEETQETTIFTIKGGFELTEDDIMSGLPLSIAFQSGSLMGRDFELKITDEGYEIIYEQDGDIYIPNSTLKPHVGDEFFFFNIKASSVMPELVEDAKAELRQKAIDYLGNLGSDLVYTVKTRSIYCEDNNIDLELGQVVTISSELANVTSKVRAYEKVGFDATYQIGSNPSYSRLADIEKRASSLNITRIIGSGDFMRKDAPNIAQGHNTFNRGITARGQSVFDNIDASNLTTREVINAIKGMRFGSSFASGITGHGGLIDGKGNAELESLILRSFLEVPELRFNRVDIVAGDLWNTKGAGVIESVDTENLIITLKLEEGEIGRFKYDDIVMGVYHSQSDADNSVDDYDDGIGNRRYSGFATSYFRVTQILDAERYSKFRYELRPISPSYPRQFHPQPFMTCAQYGNFTNEDRQNSLYMTTSYIRGLKNVNNWEFGINNIGIQLGDMANLSIFGLDMTGYSAYLENVYFSGIIHQLSETIKEQLSQQQVGGKNLLREYDIRFNFKYWGGVGTGEYSLFDLVQIESTPQLQVKPDTLNWQFPIRYGTIVINANRAWTVTTPDWVNAYPSSGSGNKNVDLKAGEYRGREPRTDYIIVESGTISRSIEINQLGLNEFVTISPVFYVNYESQSVTISGKSNSSKLTFSSDISLPTQYKVGSVNVSNGANIPGDIGADDEFQFEITIPIPENTDNEQKEIKITVQTNSGQTSISSVIQSNRIRVLGNEDDKAIGVGDNIFNIN